MGTISATMIGKLIKAHHEKDEEKFSSYADLIRSYINDGAKSGKQNDDKDAMDMFLALIVMFQTMNAPLGHYRKRNGEIYTGQIHIHGDGKLFTTDGCGNELVW